MEQIRNLAPQPAEIAQTLARSGRVLSCMLLRFALGLLLNLALTLSG